MIEVSGRTYALDDPMVIAVLFGAVLLLAVVLILRAVARTARSVEPLAWQVSQMGGTIQALSDGQQHLAGGLHHVSDAQAKAQAQMLHVVEQRLSEVGTKMGTALDSTSTRTAQSLGALQQRLEAIDRAQANIEKLSGNVLSLQDILSNKQARGAFGEIQLNDLVGKALPADAFTMQATLSNGRRADCLVHMPLPPGPLVIDAKFPLEAYEALRRAENDAQTLEATRAFRTSVRTHIKAIAERYIIKGETGDGALMFLPSEAVYAELHSNFPELVREGFAARVWIVSPTTCMATLNTLRGILRDARMREQAGAVRRELGLLLDDLRRLSERVDKLDNHFGQVQGDLRDIKISSEKTTRRAQRLESFDFSEGSG